MLIATDGACKRNGKPDCLSTGVAWIQTESGNYLFKAKIEMESTSQRGEINGLLEGLKYATHNAAPNEDIIIISDSEYLCNTVSLGWCYKWRDNGWTNADGQATKNADLWNHACNYLSVLNQHHERVFIEWTKGHTVHYTAGAIKQALAIDPTAIELFTRVTTMANRIADRDNIINRFLKERIEHSKLAVPREIALEWAIANCMADSLAGYIVKLADEQIFIHNVSNGLMA